MTEEEMKAKIAEAETAATLKGQELEEAQKQIEAIKKDNETLLNLNKRLQLAVGVGKYEGNDEEEEKQTKQTPQEKQSALLAKILKRGDSK